MKKTLALLLSVIVISSFSTAFAQESIIQEQLSASGEVLVKLEWPAVYPDQEYVFIVSFHDPETGKLLNEEIRMLYDVTVSQDDHEVEHYTKNLTTDGTEEFDVFFPEESTGLAKVVVYLNALTDHGFPTVIKEDVVFSVNVVPEFGVIAAIVLSIAFVPILLLSKSKLMPKF